MKQRHTHFHSFVMAADLTLDRVMKEHALFLGDLEDANNIAKLTHHRIRLVVRFRTTAACLFQGHRPTSYQLRPSEVRTFYKEQGIVEEVIDLNDAPEEPIASHLTRLCHELDKRLLLHEQAVLVHCDAGISRSATLITAYLIWYDLRETHWYSAQTAVEWALEEVRSKRACIRPNSGFRAQLLVWVEERIKDQTRSEM